MNNLEFLAAKALLQNTDLHQAEELYTMLSGHINKIKTRQIKEYLIEQFNQYGSLKKYIELVHNIESFSLEMEEYRDENTRFLVIHFQNPDGVKHKIKKDTSGNCAAKVFTMLNDFWRLSQNEELHEFAEIFDHCYQVQENVFPEFSDYIITELM